MRHAILVAILLGAVSAAEAQQSDKAVAVDAGGAAPSTNYVWVAINGTPTNQDSVMIRNTDNTAVLDGTGNPVRLFGATTYKFSQPFDIVGSTLHHRVFVSNAGNGTVSVVDSDTLQPVGVVTLPGCTTAHGMSLSQDESTIFVAGGNAAGPAVWQVDTVSLSPGAAPIGAVADVSHIADDCVVIRAGNAGGTGDGPGKVYFSVRASGTLAPAPGYIGVIPLNPAGAQTTIPTQAGSLASVGTPINMERTADHRFVFITCSKVTGFASDVRIIRIDPLTDAATAPTVMAAANDTATNRVVDVTWTVGAGGVNRGMVMEFNQTALSIVEIDETGAANLATLLPANGGSLTTPLTVRFAPVSNQLFVGDDIGTFNGYARYDASTSPVTLGTPAISGVGSRCLNFAVMPTPAVTVTDICPRAGLQGATLTAVVHGAGFTVGGTYTFGAGTRTISAAQFIDSTAFIADLSGAAGSVGLTVGNPLNFQSGAFDLFFRAYTPEQHNPSPVPLALPSVSQGYRMMSLPQYASLTALKSALAATLGSYNPVQYRVFFYRGGRYVELNALPDDGCDLAGESFWIITRNGAIFTPDEPDVRLNDGGANRVIPISPGFNMISLPQLNAALTSGQIPWASVRVTTDPTNFGAGPVGVTTPAGLLIVEPAVEFVGGSYVLAATLTAGQGAWVRNISGKPAYLVFQPGLVTKPTAPSFSPGAPASGSMPPPPPGASLGNSGSSSSGCGLLGLEGLLAVLLVRSRRRR